MTFACSRRSLVAMALAAGLVLPVAASAAGPGGNSDGHQTPTAGSHQRPSTSRPTSRHQVSGILTGMTGMNGTTVPTMPAALTVQAGSTPIIVTVPATTTVVRGYGGHASLDEFAPNDRISAQGSFQPGSTTTFNARWIKDWSVQAHSRVVGNVLSLQSNGLTLQVARRGSQRSQPMTVNLTSSTLLVSGTVTVTVSALQPGMRVLAMGGYNRTQSTMRASRVRVLSARSARNARRRQGT
jgi:hypothetical protein